MLLENQIPLSVGLPSKHLWKVRDRSNKLQQETLCSPGGTGCLIAGIHLPHLLSSSSQQGHMIFLRLSLFHLLLTLSSLLSVLPASSWPYYQSDFPSYTSEWICKGKDWVLWGFLFLEARTRFGNHWFVCPFIHSSMYSTTNRHIYVCVPVSIAVSLTIYRSSTFWMSNTVPGTRNIMQEKLTV